MLIVFGALVEYALVNVLHRRELIALATLQEDHITPSTTKCDQVWGQNKLKRQSTHIDEDDDEEIHDNEVSMYEWQ